MPRYDPPAASAMLAAMPRPLSLRLTRVLYSLAMYLLLPVILYHLVWRGLRYRGYLRRWPERFGCIDPPHDRPVIWVHAVSVGEVNAAAPLVAALLGRYPDHLVAVTCFTPTGSERIQTLWGAQVLHCYVPYDLPDAVNRFFDRLRPRLAVIMETEIWPNLFMACERRKIPLLIANARLSERSLQGYGPVRKAMARVLACASVIATQSRDDAQRLRQLGAVSAALHAVGNLKYDLDLPPGMAEAARAWRGEWGGRPVWIAASTHPEEESAVLGMHARIRAAHPNALLLWAPRHPERFRPVQVLAREAGLRVRSRSRHEFPDRHCDCFVIDTLGELLSFYASADVAFVGGSLQAIGGHNVLEPAALSVPAVVGPHTFNFAEITRRLGEAGALCQAPDAEAIAAVLIELLADPDKRLRMGRAGAELVSAERGAVARTMALIESCYRPS